MCIKNDFNQFFKSNHILDINCFVNSKYIAVVAEVVVVERHDLNSKF